GVKPSQVVDMLTLMGDPVDNVPGAKGIGPKTAATLITRYGTLDALLGSETVLSSLKEVLSAPAVPKAALLLAAEAVPGACCAI
ncbi:MAG: hypothetical protein EBW58_03580, partial [Betaproteobacteria bacterium]|nr:hypothetical protein [Betaproteobacteria bacterium]